VQNSVLERQSLMRVKKKRIHDSHVYFWVSFGHSKCGKLSVFAREFIDIEVFVVSNARSFEGLAASGYTDGEVFCERGGMF
jgi:hypothetical protein